MTSAENRYVALGLAGMAAIMLVPLLSVAIPPLTDLPNHISRLYILANIANDPDLQRNYVETWGAIPNLAIDVIGLPLTKLFSPYVAGKVFAVLAFATGISGMFALHYALFRSFNAWTGLILFAAYNQVFVMGLVNFYFGVGLAFLLLAAWIRWEREHASLKFWFFPLGALAVYFSHLMAFGIFGLLIAGYEVSAILKNRAWLPSIFLRRIGAAGCQFIIPASIFLFAGESTTGLDGPTHYSSLLTKLISLFASVRVYVEGIDFLTIIFVIAVLIAAAWKKCLRVAPEITIVLIIAGLLALATPGMFLSIFGIDQRFAVIGVMLLFAGMRIELPLRGLGALLLAAGVTLLVWRSVGLTIHWRHFDSQFAELRAATRVMDRGASVLPVQHKMDDVIQTEPLGAHFVYWHVASLAVIERSMFDPQTFTARHQPIKAHPDRKSLDCAACQPISYKFLRILGNPELSWEVIEMPYEKGFTYHRAAQWPERYDYVLAVDFGHHLNPQPEDLKAIHTGSFFVIYEVRGRPHG